MKGLIFGTWCLMLSTPIRAVPAFQESATDVSIRVEAAQVPDTTVFPASVFFELIRQHHPLVKQANLFGEEARQVLVQARGAFDPKLVSYYDRKEFGRDLYFDHWQNKLAVPIWLGGIDLNVSYDRNSTRGRYINPEERTPESGLTGVGLSVPVGQGLLIDARRNAVRQARLSQNLAEADRMKLVNKTLFDAAKTYWEWFFAHQQRRLITEGYDLADRRFQALRERALLGDAATIDTTEALITVQDRLVQRQQAEVDEQNARLRVNTFLWNTASQPVELPATALPQQPSLTAPGDTLLQRLLDWANQQHPDLLKLAVKTQQLTLEERFRRAMIQPQVMLNASLLSETPNPDIRYSWNSYYSFRPQNYKVSMDLVFPLFLRKERGKLREVQVKNQQVQLEQLQTGRDITNTVQSAYNQLQTLARQVAVQQQTIQNQQLLLQAEQQKFELGESSLFLINARETKLIDLQVKGEELKTKYQKAIAELYFVAGTNGQADR
ncbi:TolC family protein [Spirosoma utsteinense]|uniref:Outer membrane protein TolC n=1 Tax=Spirosoma utsteinense TaxID=2585773 RepID=A0ABR6W0M7_9BACT|nr:TolC family protein [Spirosoma utsteinense]MBC3784606.1 outer membrane protein TolC [Spirosoma utsteinense]MBC3789641.1 outer membrane protein TolC [Spirosoma utsteinense]